ncbi:MAG: hypothetical protein JXR22_05215 [Prolixibacteraceae bacterium]|nr:hypothetical protein [Prolixibacteraceae bacterium]
MLTIGSAMAYAQDANFNFSGTIRYDYELVGDAHSVKVVHQQSKKLPQWGGPTNKLIDAQNLGTYAYQLFDLATGELIFQKGFSPLFQEWQTTAEAFAKQRSYYQALFFPVPLKDVRILINERDEKNSWKLIFTDTLKVDDYFVIQETPVKYPAKYLRNNGHPHEKIDILILAEGYRVDEQVKFLSDASRLTDSLFKAEPFASYADRFNVQAIQVPSQESGTDVPGENIYRNTAFNAHFYTFDSPRYLTTSDMKAIYDAIDAYAWDHLYLLVNTDRYGGGGMFNFLSVCSSDNEQSPFVFCHEFGHGFAGLGDEYYTSSTSYEIYYSKTVEPWEPNLTTLVDFGAKWKHMLLPGIPVPTPREEIFSGKVGVFEGGGYEPKGIYSPVMSCWMKERVAGKFCPVCEKAIETVILNCSK